MKQVPCLIFKLVLVVTLNRLRSTEARSFPKGTRAAVLRALNSNARRAPSKNQRNLDLFDLVPNEMADALLLKKSSKKSKGSKGSKSKGCSSGSTCAPFSGSSALTAHPSVVQSSSPSSSPTMPLMPTAITEPSGAPSTKPFVSPTTSLQPTGPPSPRPSTKPTVTRSEQPSGSPTPKPSTSPTANPSVSAIASLLPSSYPAYAPSLLPSLSPSLSQLQSAIPSAIPSGPIVFTTTQNDTTTTSVCRDGGPDGVDNLLEETKFALQYTVVVTTANSPEPVVEYIEARMHDEIALAYFDCDFERRRLKKRPVKVPRGRFLVKQDKLDLISLSTAEPDRVNHDEVCHPEESGDNGGDCYVVKASMTWEYIANSTKEEIASDVASFLRSGMPLWASGDDRVQAIVFRGFTDLTLVGQETDDNGEDATVDGLEQGVFTNSDSGSGVVAGAVVVSAAAVALLVVAAIVVLRRRSHRLAYLNQVNHHEDGLDQPLGEDHSVIVLNDEGFLDACVFGGGSMLVVPCVPDDYDERKSCASPNCPVCRRKEARRKPVFVSIKEMQSGIEAELAPRRSSTSATLRPHVSPDTVVL